MAYYMLTTETLDCFDRFDQRQRFRSYYSVTYTVGPGHDQDMSATVTSPQPPLEVLRSNSGALVRPYACGAGHIFTP